MVDLGAEIEGLEELEKKLNSQALLGDSVRKALTKAAIIVQNQAKINASGRPGPRVVSNTLRGTIHYKLDAAPIPLWAAVVAPALYAAPVEFGSSRWPSGVKYPFLYPALEQSHDKIDGLLVEAAKSIEENFSK